MMLFLTQRLPIFSSSCREKTLPIGLCLVPISLLLDGSSKVYRRRIQHLELIALASKSWTEFWNGRASYDHACFRSNSLFQLLKVD